MEEQYSELIQRVREELACGCLVVPSLPEIVNRINQVVRDADKGPNDVARIIQIDPAFTARVIQIANSPGYHTGGEIESCVMAVMRLGLEVTRNIVMCLALHNVFDASRHYRNIAQGIWRRSTYVGAISFVLGEVTPGIDANKAMLGGLVHEIGYLPLLHYASELGLELTSEFTLAAPIQALSGEVGQQILRDWHFPEEVVSIPEGVAHWQQVKGGNVDYTDVVIVAKAHDAIMSARAGNLPPLIELPSFHKMSLKQLGPAASLELIENARSEIQRMAKTLLGG